MLYLFLSLGMSLALRKQNTPSTSKAAVASMDTISAWLLLLSTSPRYASFSNLGMSSTYSASPVACCSADLWAIGLPTGATAEDASAGPSGSWQGLSA